MIILRCMYPPLSLPFTHPPMLTSAPFNCNGQLVVYSKSLNLRAPWLHTPSFTAGIPCVLALWGIEIHYTSLNLHFKWAWEVIYVYVLPRLLESQCLKLPSGCRHSSDSIMLCVPPVYVIDYSPCRFFFTSVVSSSTLLRPFAFVFPCPFSCSFKSRADRVGRP